MQQQHKGSGSRRKAREAAVQVLYQLDQSPDDPERALELFFQHLAPGDDAREFAGELVRGCMQQREAIDAKIREVSRHWRLERMARVDRNVLRLATFELLFLPEVPRKVTLNEAVELAKRFGDEDSPAFVNGVLDRIASDLDKP
jgi:transcription antitermination protein NusB